MQCSALSFLAVVLITAKIRPLKNGDKNLMLNLYNIETKNIQLIRKESMK